MDKFIFQKFKTFYDHKSVDKMINVLVHDGQHLSLENLYDIKAMTIDRQILDQFQNEIDMSILPKLIKSYIFIKKAATVYGHNYYEESDIKLYDSDN